MRRSCAADEATKAQARAKRTVRIRGRMVFRRECQPSAVTLLSNWMAVGASGLGTPGSRLPSELLLFASNRTEGSFRLYASFPVDPHSFDSVFLLRGLYTVESVWCKGQRTVGTTTSQPCRTSHRPHTSQDPDT